MTANPTHSSNRAERDQPRPTADGPGLAPGDKLGNFEVLEQIGAGGMSIVWKGYDRLLDRHVAIKQLAPELVEAAGDELRSRFRREAAIQRKLAEKHTRLTQIYDFIDEPRGLFIVMEYVAGRSLEQVLAQREEPLDQRTALGVIAAVARALRSIHRQDVLHRDLKPSNILLPDAGGLKVCDFGLAALVADQDALSLGSVRYMAPELFRDGGVDARADIYSLGMIAYEMLAGRARFNEAFKIVLRDQRNQALRWMKWHTNPRAKAPPLAQLNPDIPPALSDLVARMMEKDPGMRIGSADELIQAIKRHFAGASGIPGSGDTEEDATEDTARSPAPGSRGTPGSTSPPAPSSEPTAKLPRRSRLPYVLVAVLVVQALLLLGLWVWSLSRDQAAETARRTQVRTELREAGELYRQEDFAASLAAYRGVAETWGQDGEFGRVARAGVLLNQGRLDLEAKRYDSAVDNLEQADALGVFNRDAIQKWVREARSQSSFASEVALIEKAIAESRFGDVRKLIERQRGYSLTSDESQKLDELAARAADQATQAKINDAIKEARDLAAAGKRDQAIKLLNETRVKYGGAETARLLGQYQRDESYEAAIAEADVAERSADLRAAVAALGRAHQLRAEQRIEQRMNRLKSRMELQEGQRLEEAGDMDGARAAYRRAVGHNPDNSPAQQAIERLRTSDERAAFVRAGDEAVANGEFSAAIAQYESALRLHRDEAVANKLTAARVRAELAAARNLVAQGRLEEARAALQRASEIAPGDADVQRSLGDVHRLAEYRKLLENGDAARRQSRFVEAKTAYRDARKIMPTPEVQQRLDDTEFDHLLAQARAYIEARNWNAANGVLRTAARQRTTPELRQMLAEVEPHVEKNRDQRQ